LRRKDTSNPFDALEMRLRISIAKALCPDILNCHPKSFSD
jgi:hypothetical protein